MGLAPGLGKRFSSFPKYRDLGTWGSPGLLFNGYRGSLLGSKACGVFIIVPRFRVSGAISPFSYTF